MISLTKLKKILEKFPTKKEAHAEGFNSPRALLEEQRAQAEAVFRLMIDSVIGLAILLVILSALNYFQGQVVVQSKADFITLVKNAVNSPTGAVLKSSELTFTNKYAVDSSDLQNWTQLSQNCFKFSSRGGSAVTSSDEKGVQFTQNIKMVVYAQCTTVQGCDLRTPPESWSSCCNQCLISFGKIIPAN